MSADILSSLDTAIDLDFDDPPAVTVKRPPAAVDIGLSTRLRHPERHRRQMRDITRETDCLEHIISLPGPGEALHLLTPGTYTGMDLVAAVQKLLGQPVALTIATLSLNLDIAARLVEMLDAGTVTSCPIILSEFFAGKDADLFAVIRDRLAARGQRVIATRNHAKVVCIKSEGRTPPALNPARYFVTEGSGNLRSCNCIEQMTLTNSRELWEFHSAWMNHLLSKP